MLSTRWRETDRERERRAPSLLLLRLIRYRFDLEWVSCTHSTGQVPSLSHQRRSPLGTTVAPSEPRLDLGALKIRLTTRFDSLTSTHQSQLSHKMFHRLFTSSNSSTAPPQQQSHPSSFKAARIPRQGGEIELQDVKWQDPQMGEVVIKVMCCGIAPSLVLLLSLSLHSNAELTTERPAEQGSPHSSQPSPSRLFHLIPSHPRSRVRR